MAVHRETTETDANFPEGGPLPVTGSAASADPPAGRARLFHADGTVQADPAVADLDAVLSQPPPFWLDLTDVDTDLAGWLGSR